MARVVIGANYGDEGKGRIVGALAAETYGQALVVRFNGGAQAGHTVKALVEFSSSGKLDTISHVCHHVGAGVLSRTPTLLARRFIANPILFNIERAELVRKFGSGFEPKVWIDPTALVTTPFDVLINQKVERRRNSSRHGSCGVGINETVVRSEYPDFAIRVQDLRDLRALKDKLKFIQRAYVPMRERMLFAVPDEHPYYDDVFVTKFLEEVESFLQGITIARDVDVLRMYSEDKVIFEGAQGLGLDEHAEGFPHVTRSRTGSTNVLELAQEVGWTQLVCIYVTRTYATRHGAGPLAYEVRGLRDLVNPDTTLAKLSKIRQDETNVQNEFQGSFRYGILSTDELSKRIKKDLDEVVARLPGSYGMLAVTCTDQGIDKLMRGSALTTFNDFTSTFVPIAVFEEVTQQVPSVSDQVFITTAEADNKTLCRNLGYSTAA